MSSCASGQSLPNNAGCCPQGSQPTAKGCVATGASCPPLSGAVHPFVCCSANETPNFSTGTCAPPLPPAPPTPPPPPSPTGGGTGGGGSAGGGTGGGGGGNQGGNNGGACSSQQPGYLCCPWGTLPGANGCQTACPQGQSDQKSEYLCALGFNPVADGNGNLSCLDGSHPSVTLNINPGASNPPNAIEACITFAPWANAANCPTGYTLRPNPGFGGTPFCAAPLGCTSSPNGNQSVGCQNLCPSNSSAYAYPNCLPGGSNTGGNTGGNTGAGGGSTGGGTGGSAGGGTGSGGSSSVCPSGFSPQPTYQCCPFGMLASGGGCHTTCPDGQTDSGSLILCGYGFNPKPGANGNYSCLDGTPTGVNAKNYDQGSNAFECGGSSPWANYANCPAGWTLRMGRFNAPICQPPPQCAQPGSPGNQLGLNGACQNLCPGAASNVYAYLVTQCCPNGVTPPNGQCVSPPAPTPPPPQPACPSGRIPFGQTPYCQSSGHSPESCPAGQLQCCLINQMTWTGTCCLAPLVPQPNGTCGPGNCPMNQVVLPNGGCGCAPGQPQANNGQCCQPGQMTKTGDCCPADEPLQPDGFCACPPNYAPAGNGKCCRPGFTPQPDGSCQPSSSPQIEKHCRPGETGCGTTTPPPPTCQAPYVYDPATQMCVRHRTTTTTPPPRVVVPTRPPVVCEGGRVVDGVCQCPSGATNVNGVCVTTQIAVPCPSGASLQNGVCTCPPGESVVGNACTVPCQGGTVVDNTCHCFPGEVSVSGVCTLLPLAFPPPCKGGTVVNGTCQCPSGWFYDSPAGACFLKPVTFPPPCQGGTVVAGKCQCSPGATNVNGVCVTTQIAVPETPKPTPRLQPKPRIKTTPPRLRTTITKPKTTITPRSKSKPRR